MKRFDGGYVERKLRLKQKLREKLESMLDKDSLRRARNDPHSRRRPRPCGMTIHTSIGCRFGCIYCYVPDMGFPMKPRPYPLEALELVYALLINKYIVPGLDGTFMAFGSVTEPFQPEAIDRTISYMQAIRRHMGNPIQFSTKAHINEDTAARVAEASQGLVDCLVTIITLKMHRILEPAAPSPEERLETIGNLAGRGLHVSLFLRPLIPCIVRADEVAEIITLAWRHGARGVVAGSLRVTRGIIGRLSAKGLNTTCIMQRIKKLPRGGEQVTVPAPELKQHAARVAKRLGMKYYPAACSSSSDAHRVSCHMCRYGPCGDPANLPLIEEDGIADAVEALGLKPVRISIHGFRINVEVQGRLEPWMPVVLSTLSRRRVVLRASPGP